MSALLAAALKSKLSAAFISMINKNSTSAIENSACAEAPTNKTSRWHGCGEKAYALKSDGIFATLPDTIITAIASR
jgi:hypothetical protein